MIINVKSRKKKKKKEVETKPKRSKLWKPQELAYIQAGYSWKLWCCSGGDMGGVGGTPLYLHSGLAVVFGDMLVQSMAVEDDIRKACWT